MKTKKIISRKKMYDLVKTWYDHYVGKRSALTAITDSMPYKVCLHSGATKKMFAELIDYDTKTAAQIKRVSDEMVDLIDDYVNDFFRRYPDADMEALDSSLDKRI